VGGGRCAALIVGAWFENARFVFNVQIGVLKFF
jgi:hypothetical protein